MGSLRVIGDSSDSRRRGPTPREAFLVPHTLLCRGRCPSKNPEGCPFAAWGGHDSLEDALERAGRLPVGLRPDRACFEDHVRYKRMQRSSLPRGLPSLLGGRSTPVQRARSDGPRPSSLSPSSAKSSCAPLARSAAGSPSRRPPVDHGGDLGPLRERLVEAGSTRLASPLKASERALL